MVNTQYQPLPRSHVSSASRFSNTSQQTRHCDQCEDKKTRSPTMQRPAYSVPPANSPPLHHPVPQHVSTVPQLRSPPPPASQNSQQQGGYGYGQQQQQGQPGQGDFMHPAFGGFINDPTAQMGLQMGRSAVAAGQEYMEQNVSMVIPSMQTIGKHGRKGLMWAIVVEILCQRIGHETLLQRVKRLRRTEVVYRPLSLAT